MGKIKLEELIRQNNELLSNLKSEKEANLQYQQVLERTNNQVALWSNPYSFMVAVLGVLVTVLAIVATIIIWWQAREHRKMIREELDNVINKQRQDAINEIKQHKEELKNELKEATGTGKEEIHQEITKKITALEGRELQLKTSILDLSQYMKKDDFLCQDCINKQIDPYSMFGARSLDFIFRPSAFHYKSGKKCISCGKEF